MTVNGTLLTGSEALYQTPIIERPPPTWPQKLNAIGFTVAFNVGCLMSHSFQLAVLLPLSFLPFQWTRRLYEEGVRYTKSNFVMLLLIMNQWFAPTRMSITFEREGKGAFTEEQIAHIVERDAKGNIVALRLPTKTIIIANHQMYADWWYAWCLTYFMGTHKDVFIVLKRSLKWIPVAGWAMQFWDFIFLARSWASDRIQLASHLSALAGSAEKDDKPLTLLLYPEGTLVSKDTRPISKKFADKMGIPDMTNTLLPRSTGLHYSLRSLAPRIPSLHLIDMTFVYPGIPPMKYGQSYYTLRSIFFDRVPPPVIHVHLRMWDVAKDVPIGDMSHTNPGELPPKPSNGHANGNGNGQAVEVDFPEQERDAFDVWLRRLWEDKDKSIINFLENGSFTKAKGQVDEAPLDLPLQLRHKREFLDAYCFFVPALIGFLWAKLRDVSPLLANEWMVLRSKTGS